MAADPERSVEALESARGLQQEVLDQMAKILEQMSQWETFIDMRPIPALAATVLAHWQFARRAL